MMCCYIVKNSIDQCHDGFLKHSFTECDKYDGVLIQMVDVILPDDSDALRRATFHCFCRWANTATIGVTKHYPSSCDEQHSRKKKNKCNYL